MKKETSKPLTRRQAAELKSLASMPDNAIDTSETPELDDWSSVRRGLFYRPAKQQLTLRIDADVVAWFKDQRTPKEGYQTRINRALREYVRGGSSAPDQAQLQIWSARWTDYRATSARRRSTLSRPDTRASDLVDGSVARRGCR